METKRDELILKWGTLTGWSIHTPEVFELLKKYHEVAPVAWGAAQQHDTPEQQDIICAMIDAANCETIHLAWDDKDVSKTEAKAYVRGYRNAEK